MNSRKLERLLLLEQSGELSPRQQRQLDAELARSAGARQQRDTLHTLAGDIPAVDTEPVADATSRIAGRLQQEPAPAPAPAFSPIWKPALAAAAAVALLLGVRTYRSSTVRMPESDQVQVTVEEELWADPFETDFAELEGLISAVDAEDSIDWIEL